MVFFSLLIFFSCFSFLLHDLFCWFSNETCVFLYSRLEHLGCKEKGSFQHKNSSDWRKKIFSKWFFFVLLFVENRAVWSDIFSNSLLLVSQTAYFSSPHSPSEGPVNKYNFNMGAFFYRLATEKLWIQAIAQHTPPARIPLLGFDKFKISCHSSIHDMNIEWDYIRVNGWKIDAHRPLEVGNTSQHTSCKLRFHNGIRNGTQIECDWNWWIRHLGRNEEYVWEWDSFAWLNV